ncbi:MAG: DHHA1 domain-containing protein [Natronomonas sp.]
MTKATESLAAAQPYRTSFEAAVSAVSGREIELEETHFYPEGGGQPADRGTIDGHDVVDVQTEGGQVLHTLETDPGFESGDVVAGEVDETFRTYCMRAHTASHIVYGAGRQLFDDRGYGGFDIGEERIRIDFKIPDSIQDVNRLTLQRLANEAVWESRDVSWREMDVEAAREDDDIVFNVDGTIGDTVRIVEIEGWDVSACGGTHVENTAEIGPIRVEETSNPGANLLRVEYSVGPTAIGRQIEETRAATRAADTLSTNVFDLPSRAAEVIEENEDLTDELETLRGRLLESELESLRSEATDRNGRTWIVGKIEAAGANAAAERIDTLLKDSDVAVLVGEDGSTFVVVGTTGDTDANEVIDDVTAEFGGGGGGRPTLAQGGGISAPPEAVVEYLRDG